jgi:hypothetical protein
LTKHNTSKAKTIPKRSQSIPKTQRVPLVSAETKIVSIGKKKKSQ